MNNRAIIDGLKQRGCISTAECKILVLNFLNTYEDSKGKIADWYDIKAIYPGILRDVKKFCSYEQVGVGKGKIYLYRPAEVLEYLKSLDW